LNPDFSAFHSFSLIDSDEDDDLVLEFVACTPFSLSQAKRRAIVDCLTFPSIERNETKRTAKKKKNEDHIVNVLFRNSDSDHNRVELLGLWHSDPHTLLLLHLSLCSRQKG
jgi:hypothetical protein